MTRRGYLGIDCGTQSTKALVLDAETGEELALGRADHDLISRDDGTREQQPAWWIEATIGAVRGALSGAPGVEIAAVGVSGQQHGLVAFDAAGEPVRPAKLWNDTTTAGDCAALTEAMGGVEAVHAATGNVFLPSYTAPKIAWLRRNDPEAYGRAAAFCLPHDWLNRWLTGEFATEAGDASGSAYLDVRTRTYAPSVLSVIDPQRHWAEALPPLLDSGAILGRLRPNSAAALGLSSGIPVSTGGGDNMCAAIGVGAVERGVAVMSLGTSGTVFGHADAPAIDPLREVSAFCDSTGGWLPLSCVMNCTLPLEWLRGLFGIDRQAFDALVDATEPGAAGLRFLPYLDGERTPNRPNASGELTGLRANHGVSHISRAVLEGVTAGLANAVVAYRRTGAPADELLLVGGAARSGVWGRLLADWLGLPISRPAVTEAAARGAAIQAGHVVDGAPIRQPVATDARWEPHADAALSEVAATYAAIIAATPQPDRSHP